MLFFVMVRCHEVGTRCLLRGGSCLCLGPQCSRRKSIAMPSILVVVFVLQLLIHLVNTLGAQAINDLVNSPALRLIAIPFLLLN